MSLVVIDRADRFGVLALMGGTLPEISEPTGPLPELARLVREMVGDLTLRMVANKTGGRVSHDTVRRALNGEEVGVKKLDILSEAFGRDPNILRRALIPGYQPQAAPQSDALPNRNTNEAGESDLQEAMIYFRDPDAMEVVRYYLGLPEELRPMAKEALKGMKNAGDIVRLRREARTIGKRADRDENPSRRPDEGDS